MKSYLLSLFLLTLLLACESNTNLESDSRHSEIQTRMRPEKVEICHYDASTDTYKTLKLNPKALKGHLKHGDTVGPCQTCAEECIFCQYLDLLDFDEPCEENPISGDFYCSTFTSFNCPDDPEAGRGQTYLWDRDLYRNLAEICGEDDENDSGAIQVDWEKTCDGAYFGQVTFFYDSNGDDVFEFDEIDIGANLDAYNKALRCKEIIDGLASDLGYSSACL